VLELQLVADVGLVGLPNAGKSTLLRAATAANPKVADYAFTTLVPNLGVWEPSLNGESRKKVKGRRSSVGGTTKGERVRRQKLRNRSTGRRGDKAPLRDQAGASDRKQSIGKGVDAFAEKRLDAILEGAAFEEPVEDPEQEPQREEKGLVIADIPGLVRDASQGVGLGDAFLKHVERCACLLHVVDASLEDPIQDYQTIDRELSTYSQTLAAKPRVVLLNKVDALDAHTEETLVKEMRSVCGHTRIATASALSGKGVDALMGKLRGFVDKQTTDYAPAGERINLDPPFANSREADSSVTIKDGSAVGHAGQWRIESPRLELIAGMTKFDQPDAVARFGRIVEATGVAAELAERGAQKGDLVMIGDDVDLEYDPVGWAPYSELKRAAEEDDDGDDVYDGDDIYEGEPEFLEYEGEAMDEDEDFMFLLDGDA
jgi:Obg family GTPase CgtA-like protein